MFRFFRRSRNEKLMSNRMGKYLLYALGEIILVVIGILLALEINNWNDERKLLAQETEILIALRDEFSTNLETLGESKSRAEKRRNYCLEILDFTGKDITGLTEDRSDRIIFNGLANHVTVELTESYLHDLLSTGRIHVIQDDSLKHLLSNWGSLVTEIREDEHFLTKTRGEIIEPFLVENYSTHREWMKRDFGVQSGFEFDFTEVYRKPEFENLALQKMRHYLMLESGYKGMEKVIKQILEGIEDRLEQLNRGN